MVCRWHRHLSRSGSAWPRYPQLQIVTCWKRLWMYGYQIWNSNWDKKNGNQLSAIILAWFIPIIYNTQSLPACFGWFTKFNWAAVADNMWWGVGIYWWTYLRCDCVQAESSTRSIYPCCGTAASTSPQPTAPGRLKATRSPLTTVSSYPSPTRPPSPSSFRPGRTTWSSSSTRSIWASYERVQPHERRWKCDRGKFWSSLFICLKRSNFNWARPTERMWHSITCSSTTWLCMTTIRLRTTGLPIWWPDTMPEKSSCL